MEDRLLDLLLGRLDELNLTLLGDDLLLLSLPLPLLLLDCLGVGDLLLAHLLGDDLLLLLLLPLLLLDLLLSRCVLSSSTSFSAFWLESRTTYGYIYISDMKIQCYR